MTSINLNQTQTDYLTALVIEKLCAKLNSYHALVLADPSNGWLKAFIVTNKTSTGAFTESGHNYSQISEDDILIAANLCKNYSVNLCLSTNTSTFGGLFNASMPHFMLWASDRISTDSLAYKQLVKLGVVAPVEVEA